MLCRNRLKLFTFYVVYFLYSEQFRVVFAKNLDSRSQLNDPLNFSPIGSLATENVQWRGCLYQSSVCSQAQACLDDGFFGVCLGRLKLLQYSDLDLRPPYSLKLLTQKQLNYLSATLAVLVEQGFKWRDPFTQCIVDEAIQAFGQDRPPSLQICDESTDGLSIFPDDDVEPSSSDVINSSHVEALQQYLEKLGAGEDSSARQKKDEVVKVHKYFIETPGETVEEPRRFRSVSRDVPDFTDRDLDLGGFQDGRSLTEDETSVNYDASATWPQLSPQQAQMLREMLEPEQWKTSETDDESVLREEIQAADATMLSMLLNGELKPKDLGPQQTDRMLSYVISALKLLDQAAREEQLARAEIAEQRSSPEVRAKDLMKDKTATDTDVDSQLQPKEMPDIDNAAKYVVMKSTDGDDSWVDQPVMNKKNVALKVKTDEELAAPPEDPPSEEPVTPVYQPLTNNPSRFSAVDASYLYVVATKTFDNDLVDALIAYIRKEMGKSAHHPVDIDDIEPKATTLTFRVDPGLSDINASAVFQFLADRRADVQKEVGVDIVDLGLGKDTRLSLVKQNSQRQILITLIVCGVVLGIVIAVVAVHLIRRNERKRDKLVDVTSDMAPNVASGAPSAAAASSDYQDLCRQRMATKTTEKPEPLHIASRIGSVSDSNPKSPSSRSSTSSWSEEPAANNMDITTGHIVLSYMEDHLKNKDRLESEWQGLQAYEADPCETVHGQDSANLPKNRYSDVQPYDHSRVALNADSNASGSDYINASSITDHDPRNPAYIVTQGPLPNTVADLWQLVWEQGSLVLVCLTRLTEDGVAMCQRYWPEQGSEIYHIYEVHLVSEHIWCEDYLVRSFYLKNLDTGETRTVTQFHFLSWPDFSVPTSPRALLDFRRKVNRSYKGRSCPVLVHCSDGCGRAGTYVLLDMVLNRMAKGAKEIDIAATLEHIRDQRMDMVKTKDQFEFVLMAIAEEVQAILKAIPQ